MARQDGRDPPKGRMLFTDFDASLMGRPPTAAIPPASPAPATLPSLEDVISRIDIAFEDDDDSAAEDGFDPAVLLARERRRRDGGAGRRRPAIVADDAPTDDGEDASESDFPDFTMGYGGGSRSSAFRSRDVHAWRQGEGGEEGDFAFSGDSGDEDPLREYDGAESGLFAGETAGDDDSLDILAHLPPVSLPGGRAKKRRREASPPERPYGGLERIKDWFQPPEQSEERESPIGDRDWYEPPESADRPAAEPPSDKPSASQRRSAEDLFSGVDLNQAWRRRSGKGATPVENRDDAEDLFAELSKAVEDASPDSGSGEPRGKRDRNALGSGDSTIIVAPHQLGKNDFDKFGGGDSTVIVSREMLDAAAGEPGRRIPEKPAPASKRPEPAETVSPAGVDGGASGDDSVPVLELLDGFAAHPEAGGSNLSDDVADGGIPPAAKQSTVEPDSIETADFDDFPDLSEPSPADVAVPVLSDDDLAFDGDSVPVEPDPLPDESLTEPEFEIDDYIPGGADEAGSDVAAPVLSDDDLIDYSSAPRKKAPEDAGGGEPGVGEGEAPGDEEGEGEPAAAVDPLDVFANLDSLDDFDDGGLDDEMQAMLAEDAEADAEADPGGAGAGNDLAGVVTEAPPPAGWRGVVHRIAKKAGGIVGKVVPLGFVRRALATLAFRENWRFYCDLIAALIATASLAVIISYLLWFR